MEIEKHFEITDCKVSTIYVNFNDANAGNRDFNGHADKKNR